MRFEAAGLQGLLASNDRKFIEDFQEVFFAPPTGDSTDVSYSVFVDRTAGRTKHRAMSESRLIVVTATYRSLIPMIERDIAITLAELRPTRLYLRASLVSVGDVGILLLEDGPANGGWLEKALVKGGARLHSQGLTILDYPDPLGLAFVKSIGLVSPASPLASQETRRRTTRERPGDFVRYWKPPPAQTVHPSARQRIDHIIVSGRERADPPRLETLARTDALDHLMRNTYNAKAWDEETLSYLVGIVEKATCHMLTRGMSGPTVDLILSCA